MEIAGLVVGWIGVGLVVFAVRLFNEAKGAEFLSCPMRGRIAYCLFVVAAWPFVALLDRN